MLEAEAVIDALRSTTDRENQIKFLTSCFEKVVEQETPLPWARLRRERAQYRRALEAIERVCFTDKSYAEMRGAILRIILVELHEKR